MKDSKRAKHNAPPPNIAIYLREIFKKQLSSWNHQEYSYEYKHNEKIGLKNQANLVIHQQHQISTFDTEDVAYFVKLLRENPNIFEDFLDWSLTNTEHNLGVTLTNNEPTNIHLKNNPNEYLKPPQYDFYYHRIEKVAKLAAEMLAPLFTFTRQKHAEERLSTSYLQATIECLIIRKIEEEPHNYQIPGNHIESVFITD